MTEIYILGLLNMKEMSGYDIQMALEDINVKEWGGVLVGSIYYALKKLERDKKIEISTIEYTGHRQRAIYRITKDGKKYFEDIIYKSLTEKTSLYPSNLYVGLTFIENFPNEAVRKSLETQLQHLEEEKVSIKKGRKDKTNAFNGEIPKLVEITFDNMIDNIELQISYVKKIIELL